MSNEASKFKIGGTYFTREGFKVALQAVTTDEQFVVEQLVEVEAYDGTDTYTGATFLVGQIFEKAPKQLVEAELATLNAQADELRKANLKARSEVLEAERDVRQRLDKLKKFKGLERIEEFLDGKMTHVVFDSYSDYEVSTIDEKFQQRDDFNRKPEGIKLISLFGKSNGDLEWMVNDWRDGSGTWRWFEPCTSEEEAKEKRAARIVSDLDASRSYLTGNNTYYAIRAVQRALAHGVPVPDDLLEVYRREVGATQRKQAEELRKTIDAATAKLAALEQKNAA